VISENAPSPLFYDSSNTASLLYSGAWTAGMQDGIPNATVSAPFRKTTEAGASVSFSFTGANAVAVKGFTSSENGMYSVVSSLAIFGFEESGLTICPSPWMGLLGNLMELHCGSFRTHCYTSVLGSIQRLLTNST
jgi:hypothetical protein